MIQDPFWLSHIPMTVFFFFLKNPDHAVSMRLV